MNNSNDSAGYSGMLTELGFFVVATIACAAFGTAIYWVLL